MTVADMTTDSSNADECTPVASVFQYVFMCCHQKKCHDHSHYTQVNILKVREQIHGHVQVS